MTRSQRRLHVLIWPVLVAVCAWLFVVGVRIRPDGDAEFSTKPLASETANEESAAGGTP